MDTLQCIVEAMHVHASDKKLTEKEFAAKYALLSEYSYGRIRVEE